MTTAMLKLENRAVLRLSGSETKTFLQGLVTNDVMKVTADAALYAGLLTPQGKFLFDMMIVADGDDLLLDIEAERKPDLMRRLMMYKLRANVTIADETDLSVWVSFSKPSCEGVACQDSRHEGMGWRLITNKIPDNATLLATTYEAKRLSLGVPDGSRDMEVEKYFWLETDAERLNGVSFTKGCFVGQELTARMKHRTALKKKLVAVKAEGGSLTPGQTLLTPDGKNAGEIRTTDGTHAIAYLRLEFGNTSLNADGVPVHLA